MKDFLELIRLGIGKADKVALSDHIDWTQIEDMASRHGLTAIIADGIEKLLESKKPPKDLLLQWVGSVLQNYELRYQDYRLKIGQLAKFYYQHGFKLMVLKGYGLSLNYPNPSHRPCGDIDIWLFGKQKEADKALEAWFKVQGSGFKVDGSHHHHTVFEWQGFTVENHYDFVNVHAHKSSAGLEKVFKSLGEDDSHSVEVLGEKVYLPSPNLHALFLIRHMVSHFAAAEITLRQVLDWAFFVEKHTKDVDWEWLE